MKDLLQEFRTWDTFEDMRNGFCASVRQLPQKMEVCDKKRVVEAMEELHTTLQCMFEPIKRQYYEARELYCATLNELIEEHPYVVDQPWFESVFSDLQKLSFQLRAKTIDENKWEMMLYKVDLKRIWVLYSELQRAEDMYLPLSKKVEQLGTLIDCVASFINRMDDDQDLEDCTSEEVDESSLFRGVGGRRRHTFHSSDEDEEEDPLDLEASSDEDYGSDENEDYSHDQDEDDQLLDQKDSSTTSDGIASKDETRF